jgi:3-deoxy-D-manno-octulosonic-acid transferase
MKFDASQSTPPSDLNVRELMTRAGRKPGAPVLVGGSTHAGEERLLAALAQRLRREFPDLFLVLVPRHFERCGEVFEQLRAAGLTPVLRSALREPPPAPDTRAQTLLVDSTGELIAFYAESDVVFVGKSLCAQGGQNPIEPAALGKAVVLGPHMQNFPGVTQQLVAADAVLQVKDESDLEQTLAELLRSSSRRQALGNHALAVVRESTGAARRTATLTVERLAELWKGGSGGVTRSGI